MFHTLSLILLLLFALRYFLLVQALEIIPYTLAENAGINPIQMVTELRNRHAAGVTSAGINVRQGVVADMWAEKVVQPLLVNTSEISLATECVGMILKIGESNRTFLHTFSFSFIFFILISYFCHINLFCR